MPSGPLTSHSNYGGGWNANFDLGGLINLYESATEPIESKRTAQLLRRYAQFKAAGIDPSKQPLGVQREAFTYVPDVWDKVKQALGGMKIPKYVAEPSMREVETPPLPKGFETEGMWKGKGLPPPPAKIEETFFQPQPPANVPSPSDISYLNKSMDAAKITDPDLRDQIVSQLGYNVSAKTITSQIKDFRKMASFGDDPEQREAIFKSLVTKDPSFMDAYLPKDVIEAEDTIGKVRSQPAGQGKTDYDIAQEHLKPTTFSKWFNYNKARVQIEEGKAARGATLEERRLQNQRMDEDRDALRKQQFLEFTQRMTTLKDAARDRAEAVRQRAGDKKEAADAKAEEKEWGKVEKRVTDFFRRFEREYDQIRAGYLEKGKSFGTLMTDIDFWNSERAKRFRAEYGTLIGNLPPIDHVPTPPETLDIIERQRQGKGGKTPPVPEQILTYTLGDLKTSLEAEQQRARKEGRKPPTEEEARKAIEARGYKFAGH